MYKLANRQVSQTSAGIVPSPNPKIIEVEPIEYEFEALESLANGGLYTSDTILKYQKILISPMEETVISSRIVSGYSSQVAWTFSKSYFRGTRNYTKRQGFIYN